MSEAMRAHPRLSDNSKAIDKRIEEASVQHLMIWFSWEILLWKWGFCTAVCYEPAPVVQHCSDKHEPPTPRTIALLFFFPFSLLAVASPICHASSRLSACWGFWELPLLVRTHREMGSIITSPAFIQKKEKRMELYSGLRAALHFFLGAKIKLSSWRGKEKLPVK